MCSSPLMTGSRAPAFCIGGVSSLARALSVAITAVVHVPYLVALARAYDHGDFSLAYPLARGGGRDLSPRG